MRKFKVLAISRYSDKIAYRPEAMVFIQLFKAGVDVTIMTDKGSYWQQEFEKEGIRTIDFHPKKKVSKKETAFIREELIKGAYDFLQLFNSQAIINGIEAAMHLPVKVILYRGYSANVNWWDPTAYLKYLNPRVDAIICNSIGVKQMFDRQLFFKNDKAVVINKGHMPEWYEVAPISRASLGIPEDALVVVTVSNNRNMKGMKYWFGAVKALEPGMNIHFVVVGKDHDTPENLALIDASAYKDQVHLLGFRKDAHAIVATSDIFMLASIKGESITKSVIEAMSLNTTPLITDIAGNIELVENGTSGMVVPSKNADALAKAVTHLYKNRGACNTMAQKAKERVKTRLSTAHTLKETLKLYEDLLKK